jgi:hypothetical protein
LHEALARHDLRYQRRGSGALIIEGDLAVKASEVARGAGLGSLERRFGPFRQGTPQAADATPQPRPTDEAMSGAPPQWARYSRERRAHYERRATDYAAMRQRHDDERSTFRVAQRAEREEVLGAMPPRSRQAMRSLLAAQQAAAKAELTDRLAAERKALRERHQPFPDLKEWLQARDPKAAHEWRHRLSSAATLSGSQPSTPQPGDIRNFTGTIHGRAVYYHRRATDAPAASFVDHGRTIRIHDTQHEDAVLASLQLAAQKWRTIHVEGDDRLKAAVVRLAARDGFRIDNEELQEAIAQERARRAPPEQHAALARPDRPSMAQELGVSPAPKQARPSMAQELGISFGAALNHPATAAGEGRAVASATPPPAASAPSRQQPAPDAASSAMFSTPNLTPPVPPDELAMAPSPARVKQLRAAFDTYHQAVAADRYRVTAIRLAPDGSRMAFVLDKRDGHSIGFTPEELRSRMAELARLENRGENLYLTPLSRQRHHLLVDDMTEAKLSDFFHAGFKPAVVLESSPHNFQAILTVPHSGSPDDRLVGNELTRRLNRDFGDPNLSGAVHPHRLPDAENRKPKHRREDGTYPRVQLTRSDGGTCEHALALARDIAEERAGALARAGARPSAPAAAGVGTTAAYYLHQRDVALRFTDADPSRVDGMVAVRLRATGHSSPAVQAAIEQGGPIVRPPERQTSHDWQLYAKRTVEYAFGPAGDVQLERTARQHDAWRRLEQGAQVPARRPVSDREPTPGV